MQRARTEGEKLKSETARLDEARTRLAALQDMKRQSLSERQAELDRVRDAAAKIAKNVEEQIDLLARLEREVSEREAGAKSGGRIILSRHLPTCDRVRLWSRLRLPQGD